MNKDWKKEFDEKYMDKFSFEHWKNNGGNSPGQIKTFIQSLLDQKDQEIAETRDKMGDHIIELIDKLEKKDREWKDKIEDIELDEFLSDEKYNNGYNNGHKEATKEWKDKIEKALDISVEIPREGETITPHIQAIAYNQAIGVKCLKDNKLQHTKNTGLGGKALQ